MYNRRTLVSWEVGDPMHPPRSLHLGAGLGFSSPLTIKGKDERSTPLALCLFAWLGYACGAQGVGGSSAKRGGTLTVVQGWTSHI
jgi:hypothetical protein